MRHKRELWVRGLLIALVTLHIANPFLSRLDFGGLILAVLVVALFITGVYAMYEKRSAVLIGVLTGVPFFVVTVVEGIRTGGADTQSTGLIAGVASTPFSFYLAFSILGYVYARSESLDDRLIGAGCVYMLLGQAWSGVHALIELTAPGSYIVVTDPDATITWGLLQYYSLVTLTTLGYGDVLPVSDAARSSATLEAVTGVLFTVLVVARLVSVLRIQDATSGE
jgi:hypothetical protein